MQYQIIKHHLKDWLLWRRPQHIHPLLSIEAQIATPTVACKEVGKEHIQLFNYDACWISLLPVLECLKKLLDTKDGDLYQSNCWMMRRVHSSAVCVERDMNLLKYQQYQTCAVAISELGEACTWRPRPHILIISIWTSFSWESISTLCAPWPQERKVNDEEYKKTKRLFDNPRWRLPCNSKIVEYICYSRREGKMGIMKHPMSHWRLTTPLLTPYITCISMRISWKGSFWCQR